MTTLVIAILWMAPPPPDRRGIVGTTGYAAAEAEDSPATMHDLETVTGAIDPHELIGQRVDFHVTAGPPATERTFWIGTKDNRVLVVPRQGGVAPRPGQLVRITGTIEHLRPELDDQKIYISADSLTPAP